MEQDIHDNFFEYFSDRSVPKEIIDTLDAVVLTGGTTTYYGTHRMSIPIEGGWYPSNDEKRYVWEPVKGVRLATTVNNRETRTSTVRYEPVDMPELYVVGAMEGSYFDWGEIPILSFTPKPEPEEQRTDFTKVYLPKSGFAHLLDFGPERFKLNHSSHYLGNATHPSESRVNWFEEPLQFDMHKRFFYIRSPNEEIDLDAVATISFNENDRKEEYSLVYENTSSVLREKSYAINFSGGVRWWFNTDLLLRHLDLKARPL